MLAPLLAALTTTVPVTWVAGARSAPSWLDKMKIDVRREARGDPELRLLSCATPQHEALEAFRWMRELVASGKAHPEEIAIAAANPTDFDDHMMALSADANIPIHFVHGVKTVTHRDGQTAAALAEALIKGISQERVRRLFALLHDASKAIADLPRDWTRVLPSDAPLTTSERWHQAFAQVEAEDWPDGVDRSSVAFQPGEAFQFDWSEDWAIIGGERIAELFLHQELARLMDNLEKSHGFQRALRNFGMELQAHAVAPRSSASQMTVGALERQAKGAFFIVQISRADGDVHLNPPENESLQEGDTVLTLGRPDRGAAVANLFESRQLGGARNL